MKYTRWGLENALAEKYCDQNNKDEDASPSNSCNNDLWTPDDTAI